MVPPLDFSSQNSYNVDKIFYFGGTMNQPTKKPELLCPAGSPEALRAAIEGGADAVYVGGVAFNARMNAKNFTAEELREGIALAHAYGVKVYVTANTLILDRELDDYLRAAETAYLAGADALIVADLGAASLLRDRIPISLHASTQVSGHGAAAAAALADRGFCRMVCAREMGEEELRAFVKNSPIEAEVFVHGALCVCHSGQCLFSSLVGGRSGNRGECAQPCRLPFGNGKKEEYPLSLKDLSLARHVPALCDMGIASFKIEGRMKSPEYVRDVATVWRRLIDEHRGADASELSLLASVFSRGGLTDGYYTKTIGRGMLGIRSDSDKQSTRSLTPFEGLTKKIPLTVEAVIRRDRPAALTLSLSSGKSVTVTGDIPQEARTAPMDREGVAARLSKLGNTPYAASSVTVELDGGLMLPVSALNALRRAGVEALSTHNERRGADDFRPVKDISAPQKSGEDTSAVFYFPHRIPKEAHTFFDRIYLPIEAYDGSVGGVLLPPVIFDSEREELLSLLRRAKELGATDALVGNVGHLSLVKKAGLTPHGDFRLNITNRRSAVLWREWGVADSILSPELTLPQLRDLSADRAVVYGRIPLMVTEKCVGKEIGDCGRCEEGSLILTDRRGVRFPVLRSWKHRSLILNSVPVYMADKQEELTRAGIHRRHFIFTTESAEQSRQIIEAYRRALPPKGDIKRIR